MNLTEPQAGSDLAAVRAKAVPQADGSYRIFGNKIFITYGEHDYTDNIVHLVLARTPDAPPGTQGHLALRRAEVPRERRRQPRRAQRRALRVARAQARHPREPDGGARVRRPRRRGRPPRRRGEPRPRVHVRDDEPRALRRRHAGRRASPSAPTSARATMRASACRAASPARRRTPPSGIIGHPDVRRMLMTMRACTEAARALGYVTAAALDRAHRHPDADVRERELAFAELMIPIVKGWSTEIAQQTRLSRRAGARRHGLHRGNRRGAVRCATRASRRSTKARPASRRTT